MNKKQLAIPRVFTKTSLTTTMIVCVLALVSIAGVLFIEVRQKETNNANQQLTELNQEDLLEGIKIGSDFKTVSPDYPLSVSGSSARATESSKPGDMLEYNPIKDVKRIFAGKLLFSPSSVTLSVSNPTVFADVTVKTEDGKAVPIPHRQYDETDPFGIASGLYESGVTEKRSSWGMQVYISSGASPALGTYKFYVVSDASTDTESRTYAGYLTIVVTP